MLTVLLFAAHLPSNGLTLAASVAYCSCIQRKVACLLEPGWPGAACVGVVHVVSEVQSLHRDYNLLASPAHSRTVANDNQVWASRAL